MDIITARRITSGELLKYRKGFFIHRGHDPNPLPSTQCGLTMRFCAMLEGERNNDEVEVAGEIFCESVLLAMEAD